MSALWDKLRVRVTQFKQGLGFTVFERRAILFLCLLVITASVLRYRSNRRLELHLTTLTPVDALNDPYGDFDKHLNLLVDVNNADRAELERLPGIGPVKAARIIAMRDSLRGFDKLEQLDWVEGIGKKTIERLRPYIVIGEYSADGANGHLASPAPDGP